MTFKALPQAWLDAEGRCFNPEPQISVVPLLPGHVCIVVDGALANPEGLAAWACGQRFEDPVGYPYPGQVLTVPAALMLRVADHFTQHIRSRLGARRLLDLTVRLSMVTTPPDQLDPRQWQCHRDRVVAEPSDILFAAAVLYLFHDPALGGTSFYVPKHAAAQTDSMLADSQLLDAASFTARHGVQPGYMNGSNAHFERIARVPAAFNRAIFYDGGLFHSADVEQPDRLDPDPARGRLTLNSFFTCKRKAG
jgi:Family of unknown function (DUF6445)